MGGVLLAACSDDEIATTPLPEITSVPTSTPASQSSSPAVSPSPTHTAVPTATAIQTVARLVPTATPTVRSETPTASPTMVPTETPSPTVISTPTATATVQPSPTDTPAPTSTATATASATATSTSTPTATNTPSPTPAPLDSIVFVENEDCVDGIRRELLSTSAMELRIGTRSIPLVIEVADEVHERRQGLMCRETVPYGTGMLFVFEESRALNFWMFNTYAQLDIVYLDDSRGVVKALTMEPCPRPDQYDDGRWRSHCSSAASGYGSGEAARYALELPAGWLASLGLDLDNLEGVEFSW